MVKRCAAIFCRKELDRSVDFYPFPTASDSERLKVWQQRLLCSGAAKPIVCARHFSEAQFDHRNGALGKLRKMKPYAIPDQNIIRRTVNPGDPLDAVCRFCLERIKSDCHLVHPVWPDKTVPSAKDIEELFGIVIPRNDYMPRLICVTCVTKINYVVRIRNQYKKNDVIFREKWEPKVLAVKPMVSVKTELHDPSSEVDSSMNTVKHNHGTETILPAQHDSSISSLTSSQPSQRNRDKSSVQSPKITAVISYGKNPVVASASCLDPDSGQILSKAYGDLLYIPKGNTYQRYQIISSNQIGLSCDREEIVRTTGECIVEPSDPGDVEILYTNEYTGNPQDTQLVGAEFQAASSDFGHLQADDSQAVVEEEYEQHLEKIPRLDRPFRYDQIKQEADET